MKKFNAVLELASYGFMIVPPQGLEQRKLENGGYSALGRFGVSGCDLTHLRNKIFIDESYFLQEINKHMYGNKKITKIDNYIVTDTLGIMYFLVTVGYVE